jgi:putative cell wall-binding protein
LMVHQLKNKGIDVPLKFSNFMKNEKETVKMSISGVKKTSKNRQKKNLANPSKY